MRATSISLLMLYHVFVKCIEFNRNITGVTFSPYVRNTTDYSFRIYSLSQIKTMLKVISTRFSNVATDQIGGLSSAESYKENLTYYKEAYSVIYTAEAAALINRETKAINNTQQVSLLNVFIGVYVHLDPTRQNKNFQTAFESVQKAHNIHAGTCKGLILQNNYITHNVTVANLTTTLLKKYRVNATSLNLKLGVKSSCRLYDNIFNTPNRQPLAKAIKQMLLQSDFVICFVFVEEYFKMGLGVNRTFRSVINKVLEMRKSIQVINPNIEVMVESRICRYGNTKENAEYLKDYWTLINEWGSRNNLTVWMNQAFDNPYQGKAWSPPKAFCGWWRLKNEYDINNVEGYIEKFEEYPNNIDFEPSENSKNQTNSDKQTRKPVGNASIWVYIGSIFGPTISVVSLIFVTVYWIRTKKIRKILTRAEVKQFLDGISIDDLDNSTQSFEMDKNAIELEAVKQPYDISIEMPKAKFQIFWTSLLGSGEFGCVYKAILDMGPAENKINVAVKTTKDSCPKTALLSILSEIKILLYLGQHDNLVSIKGAYTAEIARGVVYLALELCELGSLKNYLRKCDKIDSRNESYYDILDCSSETSTIEIREMLNWSYEIVCGMEYLANKNVIHADLATRNVLLTSRKTAKITDFGLSRRLYEYTQYVKKQQELLPWRWMAIESLKMSEFSSKSDVWSYGITLWEIFSDGANPYSGLSWSTDLVYCLETGLRLKCPLKAPSEMFDLMFICWDNQPQNRPTFSQMKQNMVRILENTEKVTL